MAKSKQSTDRANAHRRLLLQGMELQRGGRFIEAEFAYQTVLREDARNSDALNLLGTLALEARRPADAILLTEKALRLRPDEAQYLNNLGTAYIHASRPMDAERVLRRALKSKPDFVDALCNLGKAQRMLNRSDAALELYQRAGQLAPDLPKALTGLANVLTDLGRTEEATQIFRQVLGRNPRDEQAHIGLASAHRFTESDPEPAILLALAEAQGSNPATQSAIQHSAAKAQADLGNFDRAFELFAKAKTQATREFDLAAHIARHDELIARLGADFFAEREGYGIDSQTPVFIVGMPRSGTTLTEQIASSHSEVAGAGELSTLGNLASELFRQSSAAEALAGLTRGQSRDLARRYLEQLRQFGGTGTRITDKMPHNFEHLGLIALLFPNARIVHCTRDPIDNCVSCFAHHFNEGHGYNTDLATLGLYYREYRKVMDHWRSVLPLKMLDFSYEALVADQENKSRDLIAFLDLDWEDACLDFHRTERLVKTPSRWQVRQPIYSSSVKGWKKYEPHLTPLFSSLGELAEVASQLTESSTAMLR